MQDYIEQRDEEKNEGQNMLDHLGTHNLVKGLPDLASNRLSREKQGSIERSQSTIKA